MQSRLENLQAAAGPELSDMITSLMDDVNAQATLVESLLLMQRLQSEMPIPITLLRVDEVLDESVSETKLTYPDVNIQIDIDESVASERHLSVNGNYMLLKTGFKNLLSNAALYTTKSELFITLSSDGSNLMIQFANDGDAELPIDIFEPFYRHPSGKEPAGSGLGLSIVRQIADTLKGRIDYEFVRQQHVFKLTLPHI